jgi:outer membrane protein assembly factor BamD (BamD/ComL family)
MRYWFGLFCIGLMVALVVGCGSKVTEEQLRAKALDFENKEMWDKEVEILEQLVKKFPGSDKADEYLYKLGVSYANNLKEFKKSVDAYQRLVTKYPNSKYVIQSTFMIGYRYANDIKDLDKAKQAYQSFLDKYPNHELASSVRWELDHLGQDISEIELQFGNSAPGAKQETQAVKK